MLAKVRELVLPEIERHGPIEAWIIDDTSFPKQGRHSVGVARQYCGQLGKQDNCQVAVSLSLASDHASLPVAYRLYLPQEWTNDRERLRKAGVPEDIGFKTKPEIALDQLRWACAAGLPRGVVLMDAGYGNDSELRADITALGLTYVAGILSNTTVWAPGTGAAAGQAVVGPRTAPSCCSVTPSIDRSRSRIWRSACRSALAHDRHGEKARPNGCPRALRACAFVLRVVTSGAPRADRKNGC